MFSPDDSYEAQLAGALTLIRQGTDESVAKQLASLLHPVLLLHSREATGQPAPFASKLGGWPAVPAGFEWPTCEGKPMEFLAQIGLEELARCDPEGRLPATGVLSFWKTDLHAAGFALGDEAPHRVLWFHDA